MAKYVGIGADSTITIGSWTAKVEKLTWSGFKRDAVDVSYIGLVGDKVFIPKKLADQGEISIEGFFDPTVPVPFSDVDDAPVTVAVSILAHNKTWACSSCSVTGFTFTDPHDDVMKYTLKLKPLVAPTIV